MNIQIIKVPYDCGYRKQRQGLGPDRFLQHNIDGILEADGHQVEVTELESHSDFNIEVMTAFELNRLLADEVRQTIEKEFFPVVLSGNCNSCLGTIAGAGPENLGVVWFDAHGEFNTPETTLSGFLDGMPIAMATAMTGIFQGAWPMVDAFIGALGSFMAGSNTVSNMLFSLFQFSIADQLGISTILIVSLQNIGGAMGNMICVHNVIAACATVGLVGVEGLLIRRNLLPMTIVGILVGIIGLILVYTIGNGIF